jgi:4-amino-4-deoxy-L-arabinose transferase-like glycosyltransferase
MTADRNWAGGALTVAAKRPILVLFIICFIAWFPGFFTLPPLDRDESRFAQATKQMLETGDFVDIRFGSGPRYKKPAGIHWLQSIPTALFNNNARTEIWTYRVPSFIGAFAALLLMFWLMRAFANRETAFLGALILGVTLLVTAEAKIAKTDAVLLATVLATQGVLIRAYLSFRNATAPPSMKLALLGWAAFGFGILIKGPILPAVLFVTILGISLFDLERPRWFKRLHPWWGLLLTAVIVLPWGIAIGIESSGLFYEKSLGEDFAAKIASGQETHGAPPGYYTALVSFSFWPATLLLFPAIAYGIVNRKDPVVRYLLAWAAACWLMFEATPTKLPHYILPAYPALAFLGALAFTRGDETQSKWMRIARRVSIVVFAAVGLFFAYLIAFAPNHFGYGSTWWLHVGGALGAAVVIAAAVWAWRGARTQAMLAAVAAAVVLYAFGGFGSVPRLQELWLSPRVVEAASKYAIPGDPPMVLSGYTEPSMVFLLGTQTHLARGDGAGAIAAKQGGLALIERRQEGHFLDAVVAGGASAAPLETVEGINYSRGRPSRMTIYRVTPGGPR